MKKKKNYGWYSDKAARAGHGVATYTTPSGETVFVTNVTESSVQNSETWDDVESVGEIVKCIKKSNPKYSISG